MAEAKRGTEHAEPAGPGERFHQEDAERWLESTGSTLVAHGLSCPTARRVFPDQGPNLHWQADSLRAQLGKTLPATQKT